MTRLELRRLALRATRNPKEWRPVLQDALFEHYGKVFEKAIADARRRARQMSRGHLVAVVYSPALPGPRRSSPFDIYHFEVEDLDYAWPDSWARLLARRGRVPVYVAPTGSTRDRRKR